MTSPQVPGDEAVVSAPPPGPPPLVLAVALDLVTRYRLRLTDARDSRLGPLAGDAYILGAAQWTGRRAAFVGFYRAPADPVAAATDLEARMRAAEAWGNQRLGTQGAQRCDILLIALGGAFAKPQQVVSGIGGVQVGAIAVDAEEAAVQVLVPVPPNLPGAGEVRAHARAIVAGRPVPTLAAVDLAERQTVAGGYAQPTRRALAQQTVVTYGLIAAFVVIWILERTLHVPAGQPEPIDLALGALADVSPYSHDWWRYISSGFLHLPNTPVHLLFNGFAMLYVGRLVEQLYGRLVLLGVFLLAVAGGGLLWVVAGAAGIAGPGTSVGASGGLMGLIGLLVMLGRFQGRDVPVGVVASIRQYALTIVVINVVIGFALGGSINNFAHVGGFLTGALLGVWVPPRAGVGGRALRRWQEVVLVAVIAVSAIALGLAAQHAFSVLTAVPQNTLAPSL
ncbi:MAG TPA: rhomboid family intramembrane serine protease [Candidatus Dormibacteraeota bacterium]|jgi:rhomboid protease GluP|nr:rhomboid family intramembrane serine protease [Candidatus Dormibacteraeota bacterium]